MFKNYFAYVKNSGIISLRRGDMAKSSSTGDRIILFIICLFLGWFGIDKLYMKGSWKIALVKFLLCFLIIGELWNIYDMVCALLGRYKLNPLD